VVKLRYIITILILLSIVIVLPPLIHGYIYPNGGDDAAFHLQVMQEITPTHLIPSHTIYAGQWMVGYPLILIKDYLHISLTTSFLWFNYLVLIVLVWSNFLVFSLLFNKGVGLLVGIASILIVRTNIELFLAGQIFNIVNVGIILPWMLYFMSKALIKNSWRNLVVGFLLMSLFSVFHASGYYLFVIVPLMGIAYWQKKRIKNEGMFVLYIMGSLALILLLFSLTKWGISPDPGRQGIDGIGLLILTLMVLVGWKLAVGKALIPIVLGLGIVGGIYILPVWFRYINAIQPVDKLAIEYIKTLPESEFYGNEYLASWVYQPYINKNYEPNSAIYIWRSEPMTAMTSPDYIGWWEPEEINIKPPLNVKNTKTFEENGVTIYVSESNE